jgi:electron transfer flavoprotein alpha/beta subunit
MAARSKEVKQVTLADLGIERGSDSETIEGIADAEARKAGAIIEDDGSAVDHIVKVLADAKVI